MDPIVMTSFRTLSGFFILLLLTRILGKKQISQMTFFTYISGIAMGNIAGDMVVHKDIKIGSGILALALWTILTIVIEWISLKWPHARVMLDGEPTIVIKKGVIQREAMKRARLNMDDLTMLLRTKNTFSVKDVDYAILEPNGELSVLKNQEKETVTKNDMQIPTTPRLYIPTELIVDGKIIDRNLRELNLDQSWLKNQLKIFGVSNVNNVFLTELQSDGTLHVEKKDTR